MDVLDDPAMAMDHDRDSRPRVVFAALARVLAWSARRSALHALRTALKEHSAAFGDERKAIAEASALAQRVAELHESLSA